MTQPSGGPNSRRPFVSAAAGTKGATNAAQENERRAMADLTPWQQALLYEKPCQSIPVLYRASKDTSVEAARRQLRCQYISGDRLDTTRPAGQLGSEKASQGAVGCGGGRHRGDFDVRSGTEHDHVRSTRARPGAARDNAALRSTPFD